MRHSAFLASFAALTAFAGLARPTTAAPIAVRSEIAATHFDVSPPLREMIAAANGSAEDEAPRTPDVDHAALGHDPFVPDGALQSGFGIHAMPLPTINFNAITGTNATPPSPSGDVGLNHYVLMSNLRSAIYNKAGALIAGPFNNNVIWAGFGGPCETTNSGNPWVVYDQLADRWFLMQIGSNVAPYSLCFALSVTGDPTGSYYRWSFNLADQFPDYGRVAVWPDAYYIGGRMFLNASIQTGSGAYAFDRADMLAGDPTPDVVGFIAPSDATPYVVGDGLVPADLDGSQPPPPGCPAYYVGSMDLGGPYGAPQDAVSVWRFHADFAVPANSSFTSAATLPVSTFDSIYPCPGPPRDCIPQPGASASQYLDILSYRQRFMSRATYRNFGTHESILATQSVEASVNLAGLRWYELRDPGGTPVVHQQGTYAPGVADGIHRWNGSLASDQSGNIALGYSASSTVTFPSVFYTGRLATDPLGMMPQGEGVFVNGSGIQTSTASRWGDYSSMSIDPVDDCTFWYVNEYYPVTAATAFTLRVGAFKFPDCGSAVGIDDPVAVETSRLFPIAFTSGVIPVRFALAGTSARTVRIDVLDVSGRRVRQLVDEALAGGLSVRTWDRMSDAGTRVRPGVYYVRLRDGETSDSTPAILVD